MKNSTKTTKKTATPTPKKQISERNLIAAMAMQGILSNSTGFFADDLFKVAKYSVDAADVLLRQLEIKK